MRQVFSASRSNPLRSLSPAFWELPVRLAAFGRFRP